MIKIALSRLSRVMASDDFALVVTGVIVGQTTILWLMVVMMPAWYAGFLYSVWLPIISVMCVLRMWAHCSRSKGCVEGKG